MYWWDEADEGFWLVRLIRRALGDRVVTIVPYDTNPDILICSVFGLSVEAVSKVNAMVKVFYTGESLAHDHYRHLTYDVLSNAFDWIVGFEETDIPKRIIRLPIWLIYYGLTGEDIVSHLESSHAKNKQDHMKSFLCSLVSTHDSNGKRKAIYDLVSNHGKVLCPGKFLQNVVLNDGNGFCKIEYIRKGYFNICPENIASPGYCTEKALHALEGGCVPIYWGVGPPEPKILNKNKYCFVHGDDSSAQIKHAIENPNLYLDGPVCTENAAAEINKMLNDFTQNVLARFM